MNQSFQRRGRILLGSVFGCALLVGAGHAATAQTNGSGPPGIWNGAHIEAGGQRPPGAELNNPDAGKSDAAKAGASLFVAMHCFGCHGQDASGSVGPNLGDGRWIFGGSDGAVFQSIYYGRPNGMPAFGAVLGEQGVWDIVTYLRTLTPPPDEATEFVGAADAASDRGSARQFHGPLSVCG